MNRYHPALSLQKAALARIYGNKTRHQQDPTVVNETIRIEDFRMNYVFEIQSLLCPMYYEKPIRRMCMKVDVNIADLQSLNEKWLNSTGTADDDIMIADSQDSTGTSSGTQSFKVLRERHTELILSALWNKITALGRACAVKLLQRGHFIYLHSACNTAGAAGTRSRKRARTCEDDMDDAFGITEEDRRVLVVDEEDEEVLESQVAANPDDIIASEIARYRRLASTVPLPINQIMYNKSNIHEWWAHPSQESEYPCISRVFGALIGCLAGSGGLENDIGGVGDTVSSKRGSLSAGMLEASMMIRLNPTLIEMNSSKIADLGMGWKAFVPDRDELPSDYYNYDDDNSDKADDDSAESDIEVIREEGRSESNSSAEEDIDK
jgi:hypothetical protein